MDETQIQNNTNIDISRKHISCWLYLLFFITISLLFTTEIDAASGSSLYLAPSKGSFLVGNTFSVSIFVNTKSTDINAVQVDLKFPADILQVTSPTTGESFISEWLTPPTYSNIAGFINFKGGIKEGIVTSAGLVSTVTFRAKSAGTAKIEFLDSSKILLRDGKGTPISTLNIGGSYEILVPPPEGPKVKSDSHPDSDIWYTDRDPIFSWEKKEGVGAFSFSFSQNPQEIPDNLSEGMETSTIFNDVEDGIWYFHIRGQEKGIWGRTTHFGVKIDSTSPEQFPIDLDLSTLFANFSSRDNHSGIGHYEVSILRIVDQEIPAPFFIEAYPYFKIPFEEPGRYSMVVRVYDRAGNSQTSETVFRVISPIFSYIQNKGIQIKGFLLPWWLIYLILLSSVVLTAYLVYSFASKRFGFGRGIKEIREALQEIKKIEQKEKEFEKMKSEFTQEKEKLEEKISDVEHET
jgi:hypothetical protein